jgi:lysine-ketoglutarate reductase/saccharopine dehydrogenase-like protein (TIGR00300 family)
MSARIFIAEGHLIDSGILSQILNTILNEGGDYHINRFIVGKNPEQVSSLEIAVSAGNGPGGEEVDETASERLQRIADRLTNLGVFEAEVPSARLVPAEKDAYAPENFYSSTNHPTEVFFEGRWRIVQKQRMDAILVWDGKTFTCTKLRDLRRGDLVVCGSDSIRVFPPDVRKGETEAFSFMSNDVSSERSGSIAVEKTAAELRSIRDRGGKVVVVAGPVVVHTGGADALAALVRDKYIQGFLGGNAVAVHDLEYRFFGTSLGIDLKTGKVVEYGHNHHIRAINIINGCGSIHRAVETGVLTEGLMYEIDRAQIPYCLAGSIRDDGPLPETVNDMIEAQAQYARIIEGADLIIMLSTMLHAIGTGNMAPSYIPTICIDINPAVVTKLSDRGSGQAIGIVCDVGAFLRDLARTLGSSPAEVSVVEQGA